MVSALIGVTGKRYSRTNYSQYIRTDFVDEVMAAARDADVEDVELNTQVQGQQRLTHEGISDWNLQAGVKISF